MQFCLGEIPGRLGVPPIASVEKVVRPMDGNDGKHKIGDGRFARRPHVMDWLLLPDVRCGVDLLLPNKRNTAYLHQRRASSPDAESPSDNIRNLWFLLQALEQKIRK